MALNRPPGYPPPHLRALARLTEPLRAPILDRYPTAESLIDRAVHRTGLDDFGPGPVVEPLHQLLATAAADPTFSTVGLRAWPTMLSRLLASRLRIVDHIRRHPELTGLEVTRPIIITGMPRTGTTLLYNLLAGMPGARPLLGWESLSPLPGPERRRRAAYAAWVRFVDANVPELKAIHALNPSGPDEGLELMDRTLYSFNFMLYAFPYAEWLVDRPAAEVTEAWRLWRWQLQMLQAQGPAGYWVLKAPTFMGSFATVDELIPNARYVMTHRDLGSALPSAISLLTVVGAVMRRPGAQVDLPRFIDRMVAIANQTRKQLEDRPNVQVRYPDLMADPAGTVRSILEAFGEPVPDDLDRRVAAYLAAHPQHRHGKHDYRLERFGLVADDLEPYVSDYARDLGL
ncbi:MAG: sulfotransferase family protein [Acidimicrobiales bacterium]